MRINIICADNINAHYEDDPVQVSINDQYYNMGEKIEPNPHVIDIPKRVFAKLNM